MRPRFLAVAPVLLVRDVVAAAAYYRDALGFGYDRLWGCPPDFAMVERDGLTIMLSQASPGVAQRSHEKAATGMWHTYLWVDDVDAVFAEVSARGATIDYGLATKPYGVREFGVRDLDGHDLAIGQVLAGDAGG